jgi:hypothetical protein
MWLDWGDDRLWTLLRRQTLLLRQRLRQRERLRNAKGKAVANSASCGLWIDLFNFIWRRFYDKISIGTGRVVDEKYCLSQGIDRLWDRLGNLSS